MEQVLLGVTWLLDRMLRPWCDNEWRRWREGMGWRVDQLPLCCIRASFKVVGRREDVILLVSIGLAGGAETPGHDPTSAN